MYQPLISTVTRCLLALLATGCGAGSAHQSSDLSPGVTPPQAMQLAGEQWVLQPQMTQEQQEILAGFFRSFPDYQSSTELTGPPVVYRSKAGEYRFYWLHGATDSPAWFCIQSNGSRSGLTAGQGNPFSDSGSGLPNRVDR